MATKRPNILILWDDDIGWWNISYNSRGQMGGRTPNMTYWDWVITHAYIIYAMQAVVSKQIENFVKYPPRQKAASFNLDEVLRKLQESSGGANH